MSPNFCILRVIQQSPLLPVEQKHFPQGFPGKVRAEGGPDLFARADGSLYWKLEMTAMDEVQKRALLNFYTQLVRPYPRDMSKVLGVTPEHLQQGGIPPALYQSYITVEPANAPLVFVETTPAIADWNIPKGTFESLFLESATEQLLLIQRQRRLGGAQSPQREAQPAAEDVHKKYYNGQPPPSQPQWGQASQYAQPQSQPAPPPEQRNPQTGWNNQRYGT